MSGTPRATYEARGAVGVVRLNDPAVLNAMSIEMAEDLHRALDRAFAESRALILTGEGRAFCAGARLDGGEVPLDWSGRPDMGAALETHVNPLLQRLKRSPIPWVSAVRGPAAGIGCSLALSADLIIASETAAFIQAFAKVGLSADGGASWLLARAIGRPRAMEMMLLGEKVLAAQALDWGLINRVVADDALDDEAMLLAGRLAAGPASLGLIREAAWFGADHGWDEVLPFERDGQRRAGQTADHAEGVAAFLEKRPARFTGT